MMKAYIVCGETGFYDDRREWMVCGYFDERKAKSRIKELNKLMKNLVKAIFGARGSTHMERKELEKQMQAHEKGDPSFSYYLGGVTYSVKTLDILDGCPITPAKSLDRADSDMVICVTQTGRYSA